MAKVYLPIHPRYQEFPDGTIFPTFSFEKRLRRCNCADSGGMELYEYTRANPLNRFNAFHFAPEDYENNPKYINSEDLLEVCPVCFALTWYTIEQPGKYARRLNRLERKNKKASK